MGQYDNPNREIGMRVGAATNQAVSIVAAAIDQFGLEPEVITNYVENLAGGLLAVMDRLQAKVAGGPTGFTAPQQGMTVPQAQQAITNAFPGTTVAPQPAPAPQGGKMRPLTLAEHPELPAWLHAQAAAVGVTRVWDNRQKPAYIQAVAAGRAKTPAPFRAADDGIDVSFWPPANG